MADDYAALKPVQTHGFLGAQIAWYRGWTGRWSYSLLDSLVGFLGPASPRFMPVVLLTLWFAATAWAIYRMLSISRRTFWAKVVLFAGFLTFGTLETAPNIYQSLYWQTSALTHFVPLIPLSLFVGVVCRPASEARNKLQLTCAGMLTFIAGGFSDVYVVVQSCGLILAILAVTILAGEDFKSRIRPFLIAGLVGALAALAVVAGAPGNSGRLGHFPRHLGGWDILRLTVKYSIFFVGHLVLTHPLTFLLLLTLPLVIVLRDLNHRDEPRCDRRLCIWLLLLIPAAVGLLILCGMGLGVFALSVMLPQRAQILLALVFVCGTVAWSHIAGEYLAGKLETISHQTRHVLSLGARVALLLLMLFPLVSFFSISGLREKGRSFAADWDMQDSQLRTAKQSGVTEITVPQIGDFQSRLGKDASDLHLRTDPKFWINRTTATYYGLTSVRASEDVTSSR